jgi:hypothetical protein
MAFKKLDGISLTFVIIAAVFGIIALIILCVGVGTPNWESTYASNSTNGSYSVTGTANFFYTCVVVSNSSNNCTTRTTNLTGYPRYSSAYPWMTDYNLRMQNAAGLCVVGILFLAFGIIATLLIAFIAFSPWTNLLSPALFFLASLFMLAGMAEGSRYLLYNDYSANLYQAGHLFTILALFFSGIAGGRIHLFRMNEEEEIAKLQIKVKTPVQK